MRAVTVVPDEKGTAGVEEAHDPDMRDGALLVRGIAVGVCGTDREIAEGAYGTSSGETTLVIGHESLGEVLEAPAGSLAKAWHQVDQISRRAFFLRCRALVTGAGPTGLMACLLGVQRGYEVHVVDLPLASPKRDLVEAPGAHYHAGDAADVDVVVECTGLGSVGRSAGTVNAGRRYWEQAAEALAAADPDWLAALITRRVPLTSWTEALDRHPEDIKVVVDLIA